MKTRFSNHSEVCHAWASQRQSEGRASRIFFEGPSIYSYGRHFEMARFVKPEVVLTTTRDYRVSTSRHLSLMRRAISHVTSFCVPSFTDHNENLAYFFQSAMDSMVKAQRARSPKEWLVSTAQWYLTMALKYAEEFAPALSPENANNLDKVKAGTFFDPAQIATLLQEAKAEAKQRAEETRQRTAARVECERLEAVKQAEELERWKRGEEGSYRYYSATCLRVKGEEVETTHGAKVPLVEARKLYRALKAGVEVVGQRVGLFEVRRLEPEQIVIGCHTIPLAEIERIAPEVMQEG